MSLFSIVVFASAARADIFQWEYIYPAEPSQGKRQSTMLAPDGAGVDAVPGSYFYGLKLTKAYLAGKDLNHLYASAVDLTEADFSRADLSNATVESAAVTNADFSQANLSNAYLIAVLTGADFTDADVRGATFYRETNAEGITGITKDQLYVTASYRARDLSGVTFGNMIMPGWDFSGQNLANANFFKSRLAGANFAGAEVRGASFSSSVGFTAAQLYSTASYSARDLTGIRLEHSSGWNFAGQNLTDAQITGPLSGADFTDAVICGATLGSFEGGPITAAQLYSTASYRARDLRGISLFGDFNGGNFAGHDFTGAVLNGSSMSNANFRGANLTNVAFNGSNVAGADFTGAEIRGAWLRVNAAQLVSTASYQARDLTGVTLENLDLTGIDLSGQIINGAALGNNLTASQLYSTASYAQRDLSGVRLYGSDMSGWNFAGQDLRGAGLGGNLTGADFRGADLRDAVLSGGNLTGADLAGADLRGARFDFPPTAANFTDADVRGAIFAWEFLSLQQLYSTASYKDGDLSGIFLWSVVLEGADLAGMNLTNALFTYSTLRGIDLSGADLRGAGGYEFDQSTQAGNTIHSTGHIDGVELAVGQTLPVRDYDGGGYFASRPPLPITVGEHFTNTGGTLRIVFEADEWNSTIAFDAGIPVTLGGMLELTFADEVELASQVGRTFDLFDWTGVNPTGAFTVSSPYVWDLEKLYSVGEVTLVAVPEPASLLLVAMAAMGWVRRRDRKF